MNSRATLQDFERARHPSKEDLDRFWSKVKKRRNGCWEWTSIFKTGGYPYFTFGFQAFRAHRLSYAWAHPDVDMTGLQIDHLCRNRACVNPEHLDLVTAKTNTWRSASIQALNARKTHCIHGHKFDEANTALVWSVRDQAYYRTCRACNRAKQAKHRARVRSS